MGPINRMGFNEKSMSHLGRDPTQCLQGVPNHENLRYQQSSKSFASSHSGDSQKRMHADVFGSTYSALSKPVAPPSVPSFGAGLPEKPLAAVDNGGRPKKKARKQNQLGLTPKTEDHESSEEEDNDEESKLTGVHQSSTKSASEQ